MSYHEIIEKTYWYVKCKNCNFEETALESQYAAVNRARDHIEEYVSGERENNCNHTLEISKKLFVGRQP